ncbi:MAG: phosphate transport system regulatory protein PhoU [Anaerolineae bacterium]|jgi:phosphate transport system protein|nr:MAG: phosphate transport system regulatory protein PhoU [Anaerolineae bacterium]
MLRKTFGQELQQLKDNTIELGQIVQKMLLQSVDALKNRDIEVSKQILDLDVEVNRRRFEIENQVLVLIATQQPMAYDLRLLASILEIAGELERMGDYAKGIAHINLRMGDAPLVKPLIDIPRMADKSCDMLNRALQAFLEEDEQAARSIPSEDDEVDSLYLQVYRELITYVIQDPTTIERANWLLWAAHNLERVADRVTNICERTIYVVTGVMKEINSSDDEFKTLQEED